MSYPVGPKWLIRILVYSKRLLIYDEVMRGLAKDKVEVVPYDVNWPKQFGGERERLIKALAPYVTEVEHIGSTSVPGLASKPLIDMMAAVPSLDDYKKLIATLKKLGYEFMPECVFEDRVFFAKGEYGNHTHHLNLVLKDSKQWRRTLLFRGYLRTHKDKRLEYEQLKMKLAQQFPNDRERYTAAKADFIESVLEIAAK